MSKRKKPLLTDEFLDELANEINQIYGAPKE
ncbi:bacitracin ABC transporter ATP-binding protein, partial [Neobacillus drentensis]